MIENNGGIRKVKGNVQAKERNEKERKMNEAVWSESYEEKRKGKGNGKKKCDEKRKRKKGDLKWKKEKEK